MIDDARPQAAAIAAVILAGGGARRLGGADKALIMLCGQSLIARVLARLDGQCGPVAISANGDPKRFGHLRLPVLDDGLQPGAALRGPLQGVLAGLRFAASSGARALLTVPVDTPFLPPGLASRLHPAPAYAQSCGAPHPLVALWPVTPACAQAVRLALDEEGGRVRAALARLGARAVAFAQPNPGAPDPFLNINTPEALAAAERYAACGPALPPSAPPSGGG